MWVLTSTLLFSGRNIRANLTLLLKKNVKALAELASSEEKSDVPFTKITDGHGFKTHSLIHAESPWFKTQTGKQIEVAAGTVEVHDILISVVEMAKRFKARAGYIPEGFISGLKKDFPDGVPARLVDDFIREYEDGTNTVRLA